MRTSAETLLEASNCAAAILTFTLSPNVSHKLPPLENVQSKLHVVNSNTTAMVHSFFFVFFAPDPLICKAKATLKRCIAFKLDCIHQRVLLQSSFPF